MEIREAMARVTTVDDVFWPVVQWENMFPTKEVHWIIASFFNLPIVNLKENPINIHLQHQEPPVSRRPAQLGLMQSTSAESVN